MALRYSDPFRALFDLQNALESHLDSAWLGSTTTAAGAFPPINIFQQDDDYVAVIELPGIDKSNLNIEAKDTLIRISGKKDIEIDEGASLHRRERVSGQFDRTLSLPVRIDPDKIKAEYKNGILALFIPRAESDKPKSIKIK